MSGTCLKDLVVGLVAITVTISAFYWVLTYGPRQVTTTVTVTASPLDGGGLGRVLDVCFLWPRRCDMMVIRLIDSARSRVFFTAYTLKQVDVVRRLMLFVIFLGDCRYNKTLALLFLLFKFVIQYF